MPRSDGSIGAASGASRTGAVQGRGILASKVDPKPADGGEWRDDQTSELRSRRAMHERIVCKRVAFLNSSGSWRREHVWLTF